MSCPKWPSRLGRIVFTWRETRSATLVLLVGLAVFAAPTGVRGALQTQSIVTTQHQMPLNGRTLMYTARAGLLPIRDNEAGDIRAHIYFMAYMLDRAPSQPPRPLLFLWNGGPGMNSSLIHLLGFGPKRVKAGDVYPTSPPPSETEMVDNQETWLDWADLVFVDPVGTGYSRPTKPEYGVDFYQTPGDAEAVTEFVRLYTVRFDTWDQPLFIVGHSYGTTRAMWMADALVRRGIDLKGVALLSGGFQVGQDPLPPGFDTALTLPGMTASAFYHEKLAPELQRDLDATLKEAVAWVQNEYAPALAKRDLLSNEEREAVVQGLSRYTGLAVSTIDRNTLVVDQRDHFRVGLLPNTVLGRYDFRMRRPRRPGEVGYDIFTDPSFQPVLRLVQGTSPLLNRYMRNELQFESDLLYQGPLGGDYPRVLRSPGLREASRANHMFVRAQGPGTAPDPSPLPPPLRRAMDAKPALRVIVARGLYDAGSCFRHLYDIEHLEPNLARRVSFTCYGAGHDYSDKSVREEIKRDMREFVQQTLDGASALPSREWKVAHASAENGSPDIWVMNADC